MGRLSQLISVNTAGFTMSRHSFITHQRGFGLLEVMIAVLVLAVGLLSLGSLHSMIIKSSSSAKAQSTAAVLAQEKLDDLTSFQQLPTGGNGTFGFNEIAANAGGNENADGTLVLPTGSVTVANVNYSRTWAVQDYYFCSENAAPSTNNTCSASYPNFKLITMSVTWTDSDGTARRVNLQSTVAAISPASSGQSAATGGRQGPTVTYTPGVAPEVIPIGLGDDTVKEATKPTPDITQHGTSTITTFDEITYNNVLNTKRRDNFFTVNCVCQQNGVPGANDAKGYLPTTFDGEQYVIPSSTSSSKRTGSTYRQGQMGEQPRLCDICCRDHHDLAAPSTSTPSSFDSVYDPFRPLTYVSGGSTISSYHTSGDHKHYYVNNSGGIIDANETGDQYFEACRMVLAGGSPWVLQDWKLETHQIMESSYLASHVSTYTTFVTTYIDQFLRSTGASSTSTTYPQTTPDLSSNSTVNSALSSLPTSATMNASTTSQYVGRGLYIDYMSSELRKKIRCKIDPSLESGCTNTVAETYLPFVPFHEVNLTKISEWTPTTGPIVTVLSTAIAQGNETTYNRGLVTAVAPGGPVNVISSIGLSNTGLTMSHYLDPSDLVATTDSIAVTVSGTTTPPPNSVSLGGSIGISSGVGVNESNITISGDCTKTVSGNGGNASYSYSCTLASGNGSLIVSGYQKNSATQTNCIQMTNAPSGTTASSTGSETTATTTFSFTGVVSNVTSVNLTVKSSGCTAP
jgi:prepilin-type N-terminal cleavage/methylation domain-containing protein